MFGGKTTGILAAVAINVYLTEITAHRRPFFPAKPNTSGRFPGMNELMIPTDLPSFLDFIAQHGDAAYSFMFAYSASHSLLFALFGGYAAHRGAFDFNTLLIVCWLASFFGDLFRFWIGRRFGARLFRHFPRLERAVQVTARLAEEYHFWMILFHRYPYGIRGVAGFAYGMSDLPWYSFLPLSFLSAGIWATLILSAGRAFGQVSESLMSDVSSGLGIGMLIAFLGLSWILSRKLERVAERL